MYQTRRISKRSHWSCYARRALRVIAGAGYIAVAALTTSCGDIESSGIVKANEQLVSKAIREVSSVEGYYQACIEEKINTRSSNSCKVEMDSIAVLKDRIGTYISHLADLRSSDQLSKLEYEAYISRIDSSLSRVRQLSMRLNSLSLIEPTRDSL